MATAAALLALALSFGLRDWQHRRERAETQHVENHDGWAGQKPAQQLVLTDRDRSDADGHDPVQDELGDDESPSKPTGQLLETPAAIRTIRPGASSRLGHESAPAAGVGT